jgi:serine/threonine-protein kinase
MPPPARIGRYRVLDQLGQGAMGPVYRCRDEALERDVAVKVLTTENADADARARFAREARAAARLQHPNIVSIYELGEQDAGPFMVLELLEGLDLQRAIEAGIRPDPRLTLPVVLQVLAGLAHAHGAGIVHRDVKPSNVFLPRGRPAKVMDFGVARLAGGTTTGGLLVGTPHYMSPEQVRAAPDLDGRSDLFSVGLILYELVTGERAYRADSLIAILYKIANEEPDLGLLPGGAAWGTVRAVLARSLAKNPADRYADAQAMAEDVATALRELGGRVDPHAAADHILRFPAGDRGVKTAPATPEPVGISGPSPEPSRPDTSATPGLSRRLLVAGLGAAALASFGLGLVIFPRLGAIRIPAGGEAVPATPPSRGTPATEAPAPPIPATPSPAASPVAASPSPPGSLPPEASSEPPALESSPSSPPEVPASSPTTEARRPTMDSRPPSAKKAPPPPVTTEARLERADALFERGQYASAASEARAVLARDPAHPRAREILEDAEVELAVLDALRGARAALARGDRAGALAEVQRGLERKPTDGRLTALRRELQP